MALDTVTLRINAVDFTGDENVTAYAVITPTRTVRDVDTGQVAVSKAEFLPLGAAGTASIALFATGQGRPDDWHYRVEIYAVADQARMDPASPTGRCVANGLVLLPAGEEYNLGELEFLDTPDETVTYPRLDELLEAIRLSGDVTAQARALLDDIRDTDLGTVVTDVSAVAEAAAASAASAAAAEATAAINVDSVRDAAEQATADVTSMRRRLPERDARAVGKGELVVNAADFSGEVSSIIEDPTFNDPALRQARETMSNGVFVAETDQPASAFSARLSWTGSGTRSWYFGTGPGINDMTAVSAPVRVRLGAWVRGHGAMRWRFAYRRETDTGARSTVVDQWRAPSATSTWVEWETELAANTAGVNMMVQIGPEGQSGQWAQFEQPHMYVLTSAGVTQATLAATPAGGTAYFPPGDYDLTDAPVTIPSNITIRGDGKGSRFVTTANGPMFTLDPRTENVTIRDVTIAGSMPEDPAQQTRRHQVGIDAMEPSLAAPITNLRITGCTFDGLEGFGIRLKHPQRLHIESNSFERIGYAAVGTYSPNQGSISNNTITGTGIPPPWQSSGNTYGVFLSFHEPDNNAGIPAPRPCDVTIHGNIVRNQAWECLDTHSGERISFVGNHLYDFPDHGIAVVGSGQQADGSFPYGATDAVIADNTVIGRGPGRTQMGIRLRGGAGAGAEWATGTITGNIVTWCGAHDDDNQYFGAIQLAFCRGTTVSNNVITEARSGAVVMHNCRSVVATGNSIVDVHRHDGSRASAFRLTRGRPEPVDVMLVGNRLSRGGMELRAPVTNIADGAWFADPNTHVHTVVTSGNHWGFNPDIAYSGGVRTIAGAGLDYTETWGTTPPTWGSWSIGDRCWNQDPRANGMIGWVCTGGGSPGTWRPFGPVNLG